MRNKQRGAGSRQQHPCRPKADFILLNPTHFAVAIQYDEKTMPAPRVISKALI